MSKKILLFFFLFSSYLLNAQYTTVINSNRPGFSESPYSVGLGIYQLETGLFFNTHKIGRTFGSNLVFRTSFFKDRLEFNTNLTFQKDKIAYEKVFNAYYFNSGLSKFTVGAKYLVYEQEYEDKSKEVRSWKKRHAFDWKRLIPSVAVYLGVNTNAVGDIYKQEGVTPKIGVLLQNNLSKKLNIVTNVFYDNIGSDYSELSYILTGTFSLNNEWSTFLEHKGSYKGSQVNNDFGIGVAYLSSRHFQIDASTRLNFNGKTSEHYTAIGFSFRLDRHIIPFTEVDEHGNNVEYTELIRPKKKKFFGRFIEKAVNFFKFKKKKEENSSRKRPARKRKQSTTQKAIKKKKGGFFDFLKRKKKKKKKKDDTKNDN
jgi:hypothetical protein